MSENSDQELESASSGSEYGLSSSQSSTFDSDSSCSSSSMGRGCRAKKRKRHDDSLAIELENKVKAKTSDKAKASRSSKRGKKSKSKKEEYAQPVRIEKVEDRLMASSSGTQKSVLIEQSKQLQALKAKLPVRGDMVVFKDKPSNMSETVSQQPSPDKDYYKRKLAEMMKLQQNRGISSEASALKSASSSASSYECPIPNVSARALEILGSTIFAKPRSHVGEDLEGVKFPAKNTEVYEEPSFKDTERENGKCSAKKIAMVHEKSSAKNNNRGQGKSPAKKVADVLENSDENDTENFEKLLEPVNSTGGGAHDDRTSNDEGEDVGGNDDRGEEDHGQQNPLAYTEIEPNDQLLYPKRDHGIKRLRKDFNIFVKKSALQILQNSSTHSALARGLMEAVFTQEALYHCSLKGKLAKGPFGKPAQQRNALNPAGVAAILEYSKSFCQDRKLQVREELYIRKQMGTRQSEIRSEMRKALDR